MDQVMADLSPEALTQAIVDNLYESNTNSLTALPGMARFSAEEVVGYFWDFPFPVFNGAVRPRFSVETADAGIEAFLAEARARGVPMPWSLTPGSEPANLGIRLEAHGFHGSGVLAGMAVATSRSVLRRLAVEVACSARYTPSDDHVARAFRLAGALSSESEGIT